MIGETHAGKLLAGLRGQPPADIDAVAGVIERVAQLALDHPRIQEIDVNPLLAYPQNRRAGVAYPQNRRAGVVYPAGQGALAVDVRMVVGA
jgi:hypothetical protein